MKQTSENVTSRLLKVFKNYKYIILFSILLTPVAVGAINIISEGFQVNTAKTKIDAHTV